ncbi:hypothetical protein Hypma_008409 [Hypsizygus marmoreus]|uniref:MYND-type domain-containing protein n=1 Tax=Hypsizygus marmoreus TaxID=39966 RepID=A0A369JQ02_HYPMA|nr:hypothetical protein Hypma_008409 [Hypsizygus marmoreus]
MWIWKRRRGRRKQVRGSGVLVVGIRVGGRCVVGRVFFCGADCQKEGWKEYKKLHKCQKKN